MPEDRQTHFDRGVFSVMAKRWQLRLFATLPRPCFIRERALLFVQTFGTVPIRFPGAACGRSTALAKVCTLLKSSYHKLSPPNHPYSIANLGLRRGMIIFISFHFTYISQPFRCNHQHLISPQTNKTGQRSSIESMHQTTLLEAPTVSECGPLYTFN